LPYLYSVNDYYLPEGYVTEVSSTYKEEPIESRKADVHSSNPIISKTYIRLTQLAFDSEKMDVEEYKTIMGNNFCKEADCSDKFCEGYLWKKSGGDAV